VKNTSEYTNIVLELLELDNTDWPLGVLTSIFISIPVEGFCELIWVFKSKRNNVFAEILLGATI